MRNFKITDFTKYGELMTELNSIGMSERTATNYLNQCYAEGRYDCGNVIAKYAKKYPSQKLKEWRMDGCNARTFIGCSSYVPGTIVLMYKVFGWSE